MGVRIGDVLRQIADYEEVKLRREHIRRLQQMPEVDKLKVAEEGIYIYLKPTGSFLNKLFQEGQDIVILRWLQDDHRRLITS